MDSASRIRACREKHHLSRIQFSKLTGIPLRTLENWESGKRTPPSYLLKFLECYMDTQLMEGHES